MLARAHQQLMLRTRTINSISDWFAGGGLGFWYYAHPDYCFTDTAGTTNATVGQAVLRINDLSGGGKFATNATSASCPVLQYDSTLERYYLDFSSASSQRLGTQDSSVLADWKWLHNGVDEWQMVALAQFGKSSDPASVMALCGTNSATFSQVGTVPLYMDDRVVTSRNNGLNIHIGSGGNNQIVNISANNVMTPNVPAVYASNWHHDDTGDDAIVRVNGTQVLVGEDTANTPNTSNDPQARLTLGAANGTVLPMNGRIYALAIMRGTNVRANVVNFEGSI